MDRRLLALLLLSLAVATAGCNVDSRGPGATPTITPAPGVDVANATEPTAGPGTGTGTDDSEGPAATGLPPGVTEEGLTDPDALFRADAREVTYAGYVAVSWVNGSRARGEGTLRSPPSPGSIHRVVRIESGGVPALVTVTRTTERERVRRAYWLDVDRSLKRVTRGGDVEVTTPGWNDTAAFRGNAALGPEAKALIVAGEWGNVTVQRGDMGDRIVLRADWSVAARNLTDYRGRMVLDRRGRIHSVEVWAEYRGGLHTYRVRYELRNVEYVRVDPPSWAAQPSNRSNLSRR